MGKVLGGKDREEAAQIRGMDRQTLRDWVHRFDAPDGPINIKPPKRARGMRLKFYLA